MKRAVSGLGGLAVSALFIAAPLSIASAADMAVKAPPLAPAPVYSWTGCYIGANAGGADTTKKYPNFWAQEGYVDSLTAGGPVYGGQIGCDYQVNNNWVVGIRGMWDGANARGHDTYVFPGDTVVPNNARIGSIATVVGKLGYLVTPNIQLYGVGGWAYVYDNYNVSELERIPVMWKRSLHVGSNWRILAY
jgi:outer membrane immunogenic protein